MENKWHFKTDGEPNRYVIFQENNNWLMSVLHNGESGIHTQKANLALICTAPEMLQALKDSLQMLEQTLSYRKENKLFVGNIFLESTIDTVKEVIEKATKTK